MSRRQPIVQVDAFTDSAYAGNPAGVCLLAAPRTDAWMQQVAREMNLAETAFLVRRGDGDYDLRWFTPTREVDLCGHATLASAHVLWEDGFGESACFHTRSGVLTARRDGSRILLDFPAEPAEQAPAPDGLIEALGIAPRYVGRNRLDYLVEVDSERLVRALRPDLGLLGLAPARGVIVTAIAARGEADFVSRYFAPAYGVPEDPVTGSAHCCLGPFWGARLGKAELVGYQCSARGGTVYVALDGDRVQLGGYAVTVLRGELVCEPA